MRDDSSTWADVKIKIEGQLLLHLELRGYRSNSDMTVQLNYINDGLIPSLRAGRALRACCGGDDLHWLEGDRREF